MKPQGPEELYTDKQDLADEGMLFIGDKGKILCDFRATRPRLIPAEPAARADLKDQSPTPEFDTTTKPEEWVNAIKNSTKPSKGSFEDVGPPSAKPQRSQTSRCVCRTNVSSGTRRKWSSPIRPKPTPLVRRFAGHAIG